MRYLRAGERLDGVMSVTAPKTPRRAALKMRFISND
jgi:hypothetical protein